MKKFDIETYEPKGELKGFPKEVIKRMLESQAEQGNEEDISVFEKDSFVTRIDGGFHWDDSKEGGDFWSDVIDQKKFDVFFEKYPKAKVTSVYQQMNEKKESTLDSIMIEVSDIAFILSENASLGHYDLACIDIAYMRVAIDRLCVLDPLSKKYVERNTARIIERLKG